MKILFHILIFLTSLSAFSQQVLTLETCYDLAEKNYPLARQTDLLAQKSIAEINAIKKERLPKLDLNAQATYQSDVIKFPLDLPNMSIEAPNKDQYRATLDANQLIYNGGIIGANTKLKEAELQTQQQQIAVNLYTLRTRINQNYFSILLFQEQIKLLASKMEQLEARLKEIKTGVKYGAILPSYEQVLQAEILKLEQQITETDFDRAKALQNLGALLSQELDNNTILTIPNDDFLVEITSERPELQLFALQENQMETSKDLISKANYPKVLGFAQAGYGNPGLNMLDNSFQEFYILGLKVNWNLLDWGKIKEQKQSVEISKEILITEKETFVLNNSIQLKDADSDIAKYQAMLPKDIEIISLREQVLKAATSQFKNGAIPSSEYITELNNLYESKITKELHQIKLSLAKANYRLIQGHY